MDYQSILAEAEALGITDVIAFLREELSAALDCRLSAHDIATNQYSCCRAGLLRVHVRLRHRT